MVGSVVDRTITRQERTLKLDRADRRRLVFASALSVAALPAMWLVNKDEQRDGAAAPNVAAVGLDADAVGPATSVPGAVPADPMAPTGTVEPIFLTGPTTGAAADHVAVAGPDDTGESVLREATFRRSVGSVGSCLVNGVPAGEVVTVTNLDNGRSVECWTGALPTGSVDEIGLFPDRFRDMADLTDAPVHVEVTW